MRLSRNQLEQLLENPRLDHKGQNLMALCPFCKHDEFGISLGDNHLWNCYRKSKCGRTGNIYTLLQFLGRTREFLSEREVDIFEKLEATLDATSSINLELPTIEPPLLWKRVYEDEYLTTRGFQRYQFDKFEVGRSRMKRDYVTFLVRRDEQLIGYISRSIRSKQWIDNYNNTHEERYLRYDNSPTDFSKALFGIDEVIAGKTTDVILTEGIFSKTKTDTNLGLDFQDDMKCCATFGAKLSIEQIQLLRNKRVRRLIFWFEADVLNKIKPIVAHASLYFDVLACFLDQKDPGDLNSEQAFELLATAKRWLDFNTGYIKSNIQ